jgi:hypothetical protein
METKLMDRLENKHYKLVSDIFKVLNFEPGDASNEMGTRVYGLFKKSGLAFGVKHNSKCKSLSVAVGGFPSYSLYYYREKSNEKCSKSGVISESEYFQQSILRNLVLTREQLFELEKLMNEFDGIIYISIGLYEDGCFYMTDEDEEL